MPVARFPVFAIVSASLLPLLLGSCGGDRTPASPCASTFERACPDATGMSVCVPVTTDPNNCGTCGNRCAGGEVCRAGDCMPGVPPVDGGHSDLGGGACTPTCSSTQFCCGSSCVNRAVTLGLEGRSDSSFTHCGGCFTACDATTASACSTVASSTVCTCGARGSPCAAGQVCVNTGGGFTCQTNCGTTGEPCGAPTTCCGVGDAGMCVNTQVDDLNCGTCGHTCDAGTVCAAGVCAPLCGTTACTATQLCCAETCVPAGVMNCGACGVVCGAGDICGAPLLPPGSPVCCGAGFFGVVTECTVPAPDAGAPDAGDTDAGDPDAGAPDAGDPDAGDTDAGDLDGG